MNKKHFRILVKVAVFMDVFLLAAHFIFGILTADIGVIFWRLFLLALATCAGLGVIRQKNWARRLQMCFCIMVMISSVFHLRLLTKLPQVGTISYVIPAFMFALYGACYVSLQWVTKEMFFRRASNIRISAQRYVAVFIFGLIAFTAHADPVNTKSPIYLDRTMISAGTQLRATSIDGSVKIYNTSDLSVEINAHASCGCTLLKSPQSIPPNGSSDISYYIQTFKDSPGKQEKSIDLSWKSGEQSGFLSLKIVYEIKEAFKIYQNQTAISPLSKETPNLIWAWTVEKVPEIVAIAPNAYAVFKLSTLSTKRGIMYRLTAHPYSSLTALAGESIYAKLVSRNGKIIEIPFAVSPEFGEPESVVSKDP